MRLRSKPLCYIPTSGDYFPVAATAAARFLAGEVGSQDINVDTCMRRVLNVLANGGAGIADEICASAALAEYGVVGVPRVKFDKDGFAPGIKRTFTIFAYVKQLQALTEQLSHKRRPSVGILKEG